MVDWANRGWALQASHIFDVLQDPEAMRRLNMSEVYLSANSGKRRAFPQACDTVHIHRSLGDGHWSGMLSKDVSEANLLWTACGRTPPVLRERC